MFQSRSIDLLSEEDQQSCGTVGAAASEHSSAQSLKPHMDFQLTASPKKSAEKEEDGAAPAKLAAPAEENTDTEAAATQENKKDSAAQPEKTQDSEAPAEQKPAEVKL